DAPRWLAPGGSLLVEASERQRDAAVDVMRGAGLGARVVVCEELYATVVIGTAGARAPVGRGRVPNPAGQD
ncbi:putative protein N(5)-glutamine methyltransferase, partial [Streptomyces sp. ZEA17I]